MTGARNVKQIDVCQKYFHVDDVPIKKYSIIFQVDHNIVMNEAISRKDAIEYIKQKRCKKDNRYSSLSISVDMLCLNFIKDFMGEKIFAEENVRYCGWLFQYDPTPFANWYHDCFYYFIVNYDYCCEVKYNRGLSDVIKMQIL